MKESKYNRPIPIAFTQDQFNQIKKITDDEKISIAEWVRNAVEKSLLGVEVKEKIKKTNLEKYGIESSLQNEETEKVE